LPTPAIGGVGLIEDIEAIARIGFAAEGEAVILIGPMIGWLGQSIYLREIHGREDGPPPPVDLALEKAAGDLVRGLIRARSVTAVHDVSDGGLAVALAEMAMAGAMGASITLPVTDLPAHALLFGEEQARYVVTCPHARADDVLFAARAASVPAIRLGTTGGPDLIAAGRFTISVETLTAAHEKWFPHLLARH